MADGGTPYPYPFAVGRFSVLAGRCLNARHKARRCRQCAAICPVEAIDLEPGAQSGPAQPAVRVDDAVCVRCGACLQACPAGVFLESASPESELIDEIPAGAGPVELVCPLGRRREGRKVVAQSQVAGATVAGTARCLSATGPSHLLRLSRLGQRAVWLHDLPCAACPLSLAHGQIEENMRQANAWLESAGIPPAIRLASASAREPGAGQRRRVVLASADSGRRALLRQALGLDALAQVQAAAQGSLPQERQRLLAALARLAPGPESIQTGPLPLAELLIDPDLCSACGLCARFCPTDALQFGEDEVSFSLAFRAQSCLDCGLCALACPEKAISYGAELPAGSWQAEKPSVLLAGALVDCPTCPDKIAREARHTHCFVCRQQQARPPLLSSLP